MENVDYSKLKFATRYASDEVQAILARFVERYVDKEKLKRYILMWNSFVCETRCLPMEAIRDIAIPSDKEVFFYNEREQILYGTTMKNVVCFVENLEPWDQVDACIFDWDMNWVIAVTHEDAILCSGDINIGKSE